MNRANANTALASTMVEEMARCGVRHAVISPGSRSTPLAVALHRERGIESFVIVDERAAAFFALGAAQASGRPVVLLCTSGTAAANYHPAVAESDLSAVPLVVLTADRPPELRDVGAGQTIDQIKLFGSSVRWFCELGTHEADDPGLLHVRSTACRAVATAFGDPRPGPVHLNVAWREPLAPVEVEGAVTASSPLALEGRGELPLTGVIPPRVEPLPQAVEAVAAMVDRHPRGLILAGRQTDPGLRGPLAALAARAGYPILAEPTSQLRLGPHDRSLVVTAYDEAAREPSAELEPELVLRFGETPTSKRLRTWLAGLRETTQVVVDGAFGWYEPTRFADVVLRGEAASTARAVAEACGERGPGDFTVAWLAAEESCREALSRAAGRGTGITPGALQLALAGAYRDGEIVYTNSSMPIRDQEFFLPGGEADVTFLANRGANGIDGLISSGIGAAAATGRPTVVVTGDVALLHDLGGLASVGLSSAPVRIVVVDNGGGRIFERLPQKAAMPDEEFERLMLTPTGIEVGRAAALFGLEHRRVERLEELGAALAGGSALIQVPVAG